MAAFKPGDVLVKNFVIENKGKGVKYNALDQLSSFSVYEDMTKPTMYAEFDFQDNANLLKNFPIIGEETVTVIFETPGASSPTQYVFRCFDVKNSVREDSGKGTRFTMACVSEEHLTNGSATVLTSMNDTIDNMVRNMMTSNLKTKKDMIVDQTKGLQTINFQYMNPLKAIDMVRQRAVSKDFESSLYVFFENQSGFNFKTVESLIKEGKKNLGSRSFVALANPGQDKNREANAYRSIIQYEVIKNNNSSSKISQGLFKSITKTFDLDAKKVEAKTVNLGDVMHAFQTMQNKKEAPNTDEFIKSATQGLPKQFFTIKDTTRPDQFISDSMAMRNSFAILMNSNVVRMLINGDSGLKAGDIIYLTLPEPTGETTTKNDESSSGYYMVMRLRHIVTYGDKASHLISLDASRMV